jgi:PAS domain S-box-containing protein
MQKSRSIVGLAVGVASLVLVVAGIISYRAVAQLEKISNDVLRAKELELSLERLLSTLRDAETGQRGYLLSGSEEYLAPYDEALRELDARLNTADARIAATGGTTADMDRLRRVVARKLQELARTIDLYRSGRRVEALAIVNSDEGKKAMDAIRVFVGERVDAGQMRVEQLLGTEHAALRATTRASTSVSALAIMLLVVLAYVVRRDSARVRQSEEQLATTLRSIGDAVIATDNKGLVTMANPVAEALTGWTIGAARGKPLDEVFKILNEQTREPVESPVTKVLREGGIVGLANHTVLVHRAGHETPIEDSGAPICDKEGAIIGVVLVFRDATRERAAQNAMITADRRKDEFLATLAHELRNPLAPIRQAASLASHANATAEQIIWSNGVIERQTAHMARLLDDLLDVSRITRGRLEVRRTRVALRTIVDAAVETARPAIDAGQHDLRIELPADAVLLDVDALRIAQVLGNLLTNAAKYTPAHGVIKLVAAREGSEAVVRVSDNGIGLTADDLPRIFQMFAQVKPTLDRKEAGLGIGLALSKALVDLHGGSLEGRSEGPGKGSEFTVRLAAIEAQPEAVEARPKADEKDKQSPAQSPDTVAPLRILLADDNRDACESLELLLNLEGHEVRVTYDGEAALAALAGFRADIALLDIGMPGKNGYEVAAEIRKQPWGAAIHLVALTGWGQAEDQRRSEAAGFDEHLVKPVDFDVLRALCGKFARRG